MKLPFLKLPYTIATLDIECLSLHDIDTAIDQIGLVFTNVLPLDQVSQTQMSVIYRTKLPDDVIFERVPILLSVLPQILNGAKVSSETVAFRKSSYLKDNPEGRELGWLPQQTPTSVKQNYEFFCSLFLKYSPQELWVLHPEFDLPRLNTLFKGISKEMPWHYRSVRDLGSFREVLIKRAEKDENPEAVAILSKMRQKVTGPLPKHVAINDCLYNLWVLRCLTEFFPIYDPLQKLEV